LILREARGGQTNPLFNESAIAEQFVGQHLQDHLFSLLLYLVETLPDVIRKMI